MSLVEETPQCAVSLNRSLPDARAAHLSSEVCAQLSRISHTLSVIFPGRPSDLIGQTVIKLHTHTPLSPELHVKVLMKSVVLFVYKVK